MNCGLRIGDTVSWILDRGRIRVNQTDQTSFFLNLVARADPRCAFFGRETRKRRRFVPAAVPGIAGVGTGRRARCPANGRFPPACALADVPPAIRLLQTNREPLKAIRGTRIDWRQCSEKYRGGRRERAG